MSVSVALLAVTHHLVSRSWQPMHPQPHADPHTGCATHPASPASQSAGPASQPASQPLLPASQPASHSCQS
eukprot:357052-Chlamydomonas_euryale.AAC.5